MVNGKNFFDQSIKNNLQIHDDIQRIKTAQGRDYTTGCLLDYNYFNKYYKMIATDLSKQQALVANSKVIQKNNFAGNISGNNNRLMFFVIDEAKETISDFSKETAKVL